ncbi:MAG: hemin uptake protein HemP [Elioraea sp.]|nr:hemin uptake protein HemP [Elioraea sp.]
MPSDQDRPVREGARSRPAERPLRLDAALLFRSHPEVEILHAGTVYRLRLTKGGKLLLTK